MDLVLNSELPRYSAETKYKMLISALYLYSDSSAADYIFYFSNKYTYTNICNELRSRKLNPVGIYIEYIIFRELVTQDTLLGHIVSLYNLHRRFEYTSISKVLNMTNRQIVIYNHLKNAFIYPLCLVLDTIGPDIEHIECNLSGLIPSATNISIESIEKILLNVRSTMEDFLKLKIQESRYIKIDPYPNTWLSRKRLRIAQKRLRGVVVDITPITHSHYKCAFRGYIYRQNVLAIYQPDHQVICLIDSLKKQFKLATLHSRSHDEFIICYNLPMSRILSLESSDLCTLDPIKELLSTRSFLKLLLFNIVIINWKPDKIYYCKQNREFYSYNEYYNESSLIPLLVKFIKLLAISEANTTCLRILKKWLTIKQSEEFMILGMTSRINEAIRWIESTDT